MSLTLSPRQRALLKARAHALEPVVQIGAAGASESVITEVDRSLTAHGLIKVRLAGADRATREELTETLCTRTGAAAVQNVGRVLVLWRPRPDDEPLEKGGREAGSVGPALRSRRRTRPTVTTSDPAYGRDVGPGLRRGEQGATALR